ncbi:LANO_0H19856g1_1 [Lachancea nothofagi CBS 11611]|uniref:Actin cytoskeleton-regulatory complex protein PAN1 n=1 Tax=Lachancea nothofagi CBS 11611 TaxID=1266666 RepID=A0A1G4KN65_9SACH|nr:LANO_0H19856g1_1 [Lachancea nothofagi CBS 11611]
MFNQYQAQGNGLNQQPTGIYPGNGQQQPQLNQRPTTEFGNYQQNVPNTFDIQQQQQQQRPSFPNPGPSFASSNGFGSVQNGFQGNQSQDQMMGSHNLQPQQTGFFSQQNSLQPQQTPQTSFFNQSQNPPAAPLPQQQQPTEMYQQRFANQQATPQNYQQTGFPNQAPQPQSSGLFAQQPTLSMHPQGSEFYSQQQTVPASQPLQTQQTSLYPQPTQSLQPQQTGYYAQQPSKPLQPQQTGFYTQSIQEPIQPLRPTATGFVNSFANKGVNDDIKIPAMRLSFMTANDQAKFETLFRSSVEKGSNTISGQACRSILMRSGVSPSQLAKIWTLCDTSKAGELLFPEFALAMHLVNEVIRGDSVPYELSTKIKNEVASFVDAINFSVASGEDNSAPLKPKTPFDDLTSGFQNLQPQPTGFMPQTSFGMPLQPQNTQGMLNPQSTGFMPQTSFNQALQQQPTGGNLQSQATGGFLQQQMTGNLPAQSTGGYLQTQSTGFMPQTSFNQPLQSQITGGFSTQPQMTGTASQAVPMLSGQPTGQFPNTTFNNTAFLQSQPTGYLPPSNFNPIAPLSAQKTGFGNNEIYTQSNFDTKFAADESDVITNEEKSLFYKIFDTYDTQKKGLMGSGTAVEVFRKSGLNRSDLEHIWNLCDTNNSGQLNKQEFALGMHLVYRKLKGNDLPNRLPLSLIPSSTQILNSVKDQLKSDAGSTRKEPTKVDGFSFKHNDDELLPSSRNRRRTYISAKEAEENRTTIADLKNSLNEEELQSDFRAPGSIRSERTGISDQQAIEDWKRKIKNLPQPSRALVNQSNNGESLQLKSKFDALTSRVPQLLAEISEVNNQIAMAKVELYRQRNPSSLVGSGLNGEITDDDRRKARSKALLASRMAALTGKAAAGTDVDQQEHKFNEEITKIRSENTTNQSIINDIQSSIFEIAASVNSALDGKTSADGRQYEKWELGIGVDPQVSSFISELKPMPSAQNIKPTKSSSPAVTSTVSSASSNVKKQDAPSTGGDRAAFLKEQAQRKMNERLAKLGLGKEDYQQGPKVYKPEELNRNEEDEEVRRLTEQLEALKSKKKAEKVDQQQPVQTKAPSSQTQGSQHPISDVKIEARVSGDSEVRSEISPAIDYPQSASMEKVSEHHMEHQSAPQLSRSEATPENNTSSQKINGKHNPFGKPHSHSTSAVQPISSAPTGGRNPFFKVTPSSTSSFDPKAAEAQRRIQRGLDDNDDDWSEDDSHGGLQSKSDAPAPVAPAPVAPAPMAPAPVAPAPVAPAPVAPVSHIASNSPIPIAPPLPQMGGDSNGPDYNKAQSRPVAQHLEEDGERSDDDLSIPESVDSFDDEYTVQGGSVAPSGIPPPPPLP